MSKIGNKKIELSKAVSVDINNNNIKIKGPLGELNYQVPESLKLIRENDCLVIKADNDLKKTKSLHGLYRQLINNAIIGLEKPWQKRLEIVGTGFNVKLQNESLVLKLGFSHLVTFNKVTGIKFQTEGNNKIIISGADKQLVGQVAYQIKIIKKPDAYKGKGIRYQGEKLKIKPGKKAKVTGTPA